MAEPAASTDGRPVNLESYRQWLYKNHGVELGKRLETRYETVVAKARSDFQKSTFWRQLTEELADLDGSYRLKSSGYPLLLAPEIPEVHTKSFNSFLLKTFRRNIIENKNWPDPPDAGWLLPDTWFSGINDLVRTEFVVKYLDGVSFLGHALQNICEKLNVKSNMSFEARMEGHYAAHLSILQDFEIPGERWDTETVTFTVEIQITTQLQEVIRRMLHRYYENRRVMPVRERSDWSWAYESDEFIANYLGHILHYVEGMIMEVRSRQNLSEGGKA